jgi:hypothetical protein
LVTGTWFFDLAMVTSALSVVSRCGRSGACRSDHLWAGRRDDSFADASFQTQWVAHRQYLIAYLKGG